jgi:hypothetical protein
MWLHRLNYWWQWKMMLGLKTPVKTKNNIKDASLKHDLTLNFISKLNQITKKKKSSITYVDFPHSFYKVF